MTDKELNRAILSELVKIADGVFEKTNIKAGTYTAAELQKQKDANGNTINYALAKELTNKSYEVCVEGFKCSFLACQVFNFVWKFEQLAGVKSNEKKRFVKMGEVKRDTICYFYVHIEKSHTSLSRLVATDELRPVMTQIFLDAKNGCLVASDGHLMKQMPIQVESENEIPSGLNLYIDPKQIKNMIGKNRVDVYEIGGFNETVITNLETGTHYRNSMARRFPNYRTVYPMLRRDGYIQFSKKEIKPLIQFCKCASKEALNATVTMCLEKGCSNVLFSYVNMKDNSTKERRFCLNMIAEITVRIGISGEYLEKIAKDWNGGMWIVDPSRAVILDYKDDSTGLIMPKLIDNSLIPEKCECNINPLERNKTNEAEPATESEPTAEAAPATESTPTAEAAPELDAAPTYDGCEKSPVEAMEWPWQLRILLAILHGFGLAESPLRYAFAEKLAECIEAILPAAVPTDALLQAIRPALSTQIGGLYPTLSDFNGIGTHPRSGQNLSKLCTTGSHEALSGTQTANPAAHTSGCVHHAAAFGIGGRGDAAMAGSRGTVAMVGCRGGVAASMRRAAAAMSHTAGVSLPLPYALCDSSPITRPTGVSPPHQPHRVRMGCKWDANEVQIGCKSGANGVSQM